MRLPTTTQHGSQMGETYADLKLTNIGLFGHGKTTTIRALVDTGSSRLIITPDVARALGYDPDELGTTRTELADGRIVQAPYIEAIRIEYEDRFSAPIVNVLPGSECLLGYLPLEEMDLIVDPKNQRLIGRNPDGWITRA